MNFDDIEWIVRPEFDNTNKLLFSVQSVKNNCSLHMVLTDETVKKGTKEIISVLKDMKDILIYQKENGLIENNQEK
jgi:hypothetical protein